MRSCEMIYDDDFVHVPFKITPKGIWLNEQISEHPSYANEAASVYSSHPIIEDEQLVALAIKVPRRKT